MAQLEIIEAIEKRLWGSADTLRSNSSYASKEYFMPVMGLIFSRHAYSRYLNVKPVIEASFQTLQAEISRVQDFFAKQATRDDVKVRIKDYLWDDKTGLPECFGPDEIEEKTDAIFAHLMIRAKSEHGGWASP